MWSVDDAVASGSGRKGNLGQTSALDRVPRNFTADRPRRGDTPSEGGEQRCAHARTPTQTNHATRAELQASTRKISSLVKRFRPLSNAVMSLPVAREIGVTFPVVDSHSTCQPRPRRPVIMRHVLSARL
ncbi:hypothetical protein AAFF_G00058170 [Aldrovandia affinis]|uniref:Uncharacterized protein n=1 Tax=Aldrovandia affinis TaxID=143900 RepID=A0AAD7WE96_9TELE|nr:hypothetical protein AAFF_G00058170 [Aldrovandia affinis]